MKTIPEQIAALEAKRAANAARMSEIMQKGTDEGRSTEPAEAEEFDTLEAEVKTIDADLVRLKRLEAIAVAKASPVVAAVGADPEAASKARGGSVITVKANLEPGQKMGRYAMALLRAKGNLSDALAATQNNKAWMDTSPELAQVLKAAVAAGDTTTAGWAAELVYLNNLASEFIEFLRPQTILGRINNLTRVPFNVRIAGQNAGSSAFWVGQGQPVPVSKLGTFAITLGIAKAAGLVAIDDELVRSSSPSAELMVRNDLGKAIAQFMDTQFLDPDIAAVANVSPASILNAVAATPATGATQAALRTDIATLFNLFINANLDPSQAVFVMTPTQALAIQMMINALGQPTFPGITVNGGTLFGVPVITSMSAKLVGSPTIGGVIALINAPEILLADDGQVTIEASTEASIQMLDNPTNASAGATAPTTLVSMFQTNSMAIKAVRYVNWAKRRATAAAYIPNANYA